MALEFTLKIPVAHIMHLNRYCWLLLFFAAVASFLTSRPFASWLLLVNVLTLVIYGADKIAARRGWRRVPEAALLAFGLLGGWAGALAGQQLFRHKTQKQPFRTWFFISTFASISAMVAIYLFYPVSFY